jgi:hypothetical protein
MFYRLLVFFFLFQSYTAISQAPGIVVQAGLTSMYSKDKTITKDGEMHYGWVVGADARLLDGDLYFIIGGQYINTSLRSSTAPEFFVKRDWKVMSGRCGIGFNILRLSESMVFRSKLIGCINFLIDAPSDGLGLEGYKNLNDSFLGAGTGLGFTIGSLDLDFEYQYGLINAYNKVPDSKFGSLSLLAGFHF